MNPFACIKRDGRLAVSLATFRRYVADPVAKWSTWPPSTSSDSACPPPLALCIRRTKHQSHCPSATFQALLNIFLTSSVTMHRSMRFNE